MTMVTFIIAAILIEAVWETSKMIWQQGKISFDRVGSLLISMLIAFALSMDIFALLQLDSSIPYLGVILTGILISRGSNYIHDLLQLLEKFRNSSKN